MLAFMENRLGDLLDLLDRRYDPVGQDIGGQRGYLGRGFLQQRLAARLGGRFGRLGELRCIALGLRRASHASGLFDRRSGTRLRLSGRRLPLRSGRFSGRPSLGWSFRHGSSPTTKLTQRYIEPFVPVVWCV